MMILMNKPNTNMNTPHKHAALMMEYAKDAMETDTPWERWEVYDETVNKWTPFKFDHPSWYPEYKYRRKPRTIMINGIEVPEPEKRELSRNTKYYCPALEYDDLINWHHWANDGCDEKHLLRGLIHLTREAAIKHAEALLSFTKQP